MPRSTITDTVNKVQSLVDQVKALEPEEYAYFFDLIDPLPEQPEAPAKKTRKKRKTNAQPANKKRQIPDMTPLLTDVSRAEAPKPKRCLACGNDKDFEDHFKPSPHYHAFAA